MKHFNNDKIDVLGNDLYWGYDIRYGDTQINILITYKG